MSSSAPQASVIDWRSSSSVLDMIGRTPLVRLHRFEREVPEGVELYAKAEWQNPGGSVKDRAAARMVLEGETSGRLRSAAFGQNAAGPIRWKEALTARFGRRGGCTPRPPIAISIPTSTTTMQIGA